MDYCEDETKPTGTVYGYVPCAVVNEVIKKHGGIDIEATLTRQKENDM